jgi:hypothetical protein
VLALMALIVLPLLIFGKLINRVPQSISAGAREVKTALVGPELPPTRRIAGVVMLVFAALAYAIEFVLAHVLFIYFPLLFLPFGALIAMGFLTVIDPRLFDALVGGQKYPAPLRWLSYIAVFAGLAFGAILMAGLGGR